MTDSCNRAESGQVYGWNSSRLLVGGLDHFLFFHILGIIIIPTDFHIFQRGWNHQPDLVFKLRSWVVISTLYNDLVKVLMAAVRPSENIFTGHAQNRYYPLQCSDWHAFVLPFVCSPISQAISPLFRFTIYTVYTADLIMCTPQR